MKQDTKKDFIVIDDDPINNMICFKIIELTLPGSDILTFTSPEKGLDHIRSICRVNNSHQTILFLDINMPSLTGWDVLDNVGNCHDAVKRCLKIYMLSSSVDHQDRTKADKHPLVLGYIPKPLTKAKMESLLTGNVIF